MNLTNPIVSVDFLEKNLNEKNLIVFDASLGKPVSGTSSIFAADHLQIPGTRIFDFDKKICDRKTSLPHMMPTPEDFEKEVRALGVNKSSAIVVYDRAGTYSSPRAWWMLRSMGHHQVAVLDGGFPAWIQEQKPCEPITSAVTSKEGNFKSENRNLFCDAHDVERSLEDKTCVVLDARSEKRFLGLEPEPRPGLRSGHMPHAKNLPFSKVQKNGQMLSSKELKELLAQYVSEDQKLITSCGSGVTACILILAAEIAGYKNLQVYDGSWSEWGLPSNRVVV